MISKGRHYEPERPEAKRPEAKHVVYLDHAASTPVRAEAFEVMAPWLSAACGNPSGAHSLARRARRAVDDARASLAQMLGVTPGNIIFTSGGTEADNLALVGARPSLKRKNLDRERQPRRDGSSEAPWCSAIEHHAVLDVVDNAGGKRIGVDRFGALDLEELATALSAPGPLVPVFSAMLVNNETGTTFDLAATRAVLAEVSPATLLHSDAVQSLLWTDIGSQTAHADMVSLSAHKFGGPKGIGLLAVREDVVVEPMLIGGGQERGRRSGTPNVAGIVGMARAAELVVNERAVVAKRIAALRDRLVDGLVASTGCRELVPRARRVAGNAMVTFEGAESQLLVAAFDRAGICVSAGASCSSGATAVSHVLQAMGCAPSEGAGAIRMTLGVTTTEADIDRALIEIPPVLARYRAG